MSGRDYVADMGASIVEAIGSGDIVAPVVAEKLHARLLEKDPDLLEGWLRESAVHFLTREIGDRDRRQRTAARTRGEARRFRQAAESGDREAISIFATVRYVVDEDETRRPLGEMTGTDHLFVAAQYGRSAAKAQMLQAFHRAVAKKVGKRKTAEVFAEAEYDRLYRSITGEPEAKAS
ncbi:hypothetical protein E1264_17940 [Actinomadura sp. KC216]|uniref:hypothetical protein n=1 Tax=Actinomadura sp. KC216 TaxID=2530370 RepID=UPI00104574EB|nr:hypothetical protein [Actinomadura sp. KC216]TDB86479.1 hypothetical protein E1264_17940 [Actinomadura sp. KC216]